MQVTVTVSDEKDACLSGGPESWFRVLCAKDELMNERLDRLPDVARKALDSDQVAVWQVSDAVPLAYYEADSEDPVYNEEHWWIFRYRGIDNIVRASE